MSSTLSLDDWKKEQDRHIRQNQLRRHASAEILPLYLKPIDEWVRTQPAGILQLSRADRVVLKLAGMLSGMYKMCCAK